MAAEWVKFTTVGDDGDELTRYFNPISGETREEIPEEIEDGPEENDHKCTK